MIFRECSGYGEDFEFSLQGCAYNSDYARLSVLFTMSWTGGISGSNYFMEVASDITGTDTKKVSVAILKYRGALTCLVDWDEDVLDDTSVIYYNKNLGYIE